MNTDQTIAMIGGSLVLLGSMALVVGLIFAGFQ
jgi:hypothetical protein